MGKGREFTFKEKLDIISHNESLMTSGMKISKKAMTEWANVKFDTSVSQMTIGSLEEERLTYHF